MTPTELRARRKGLGLTQTGLAWALGVAGNTVARWERGEATMGNPELVRLALERLEDGRPTRPGDTASVARGRGSHTPRHAGEPSSFVGRQSELVELQSHFARALTGQGGMAMMVGEPGIGKTWLARHFAGRVRSEGALVLWGRCFEGEGTPPYGPWVEVLAAYARVVEPDRLRRQLGSAAPPLARLVPEIRASLPHTPAPASLSPADERLRLYDAVAHALRTVSQEQSLLVVLDDLHWADRDALGLLAYLGRFVTSMRLLVVGTYRDVEVDRHHPLTEVLGLLRHDLDYAYLPIRGLGYPEFVEYLGQTTGQTVPDTLAERIYAETGGSPLYVRELLRHLMEEHGIAHAAGQPRGGVSLIEDSVPEGVRQVIRRRLARLSEPTQRVLEVAAGFGGQFPFAAVKAVTGLSDDAMLESIDEALAAGLLHGVSGPGEVYDFAHALLRHTLYEELNASRKARLHRRIAEALERGGSGGYLRAEAEVAAHYHASVSLAGAERGISYALAAAEQARRGYAREQAVHFLRLARDLAEGSGLQTRADVLCRLAVAEAEAVLLDDAARTAQAALEVLSEAGFERNSAAEFVSTVARVLKEAGASHLVWEPLVQRGLGLVGDRRDLSWARLVLLQDQYEVISTGLINTGRWTGHDPDALAIARGSGNEDDYALSLEPLEWRSRTETEAIRSVARAWQQPAAELHALNVVARDLLYRHGAFREAADRYRELLEVSTRYGSVPGQVEALAQLSACLRAVGELAESERMLRQSREMVSRLGTEHRLHFVVETGLTIGLAYYMGGDWPALARSAMRFMASPQSVRSPLGLTAAAFAALACVRAGTHAEARRILAALVPVLDRMQPRDYMHNYVAGVAGTSIWELTGHEFAVSARQLALDLIAAGVGGGPNHSPELTVARMAGLLGNLTEAETYFAQARTITAALGQRPLVAIANHDEALVRIRLKVPDGVRTTALLDAALAEFGSLGMAPWAKQAQALAGAVASTKADDAELVLLSPREREVAELVAAGYTNRRIAEELVIAEATAERHVSNIFGKLGLGSRSQLAVWAAGQRS